MDYSRFKDLKEKTRREFLNQASFLSAAAILSPAILTASSFNADIKEGDNYTFLFQGDSITDGNRGRNMDWNHVLGHSYAYLIAARLWFELPKKGFHFFNRGISGNTVPDLAKRWNDDTISLKPDLVSILVGINDTSHAVYGDKKYTIESYDADYRALLTQTKQQLPGVQLVICEPFVLPIGKVKENWNDYQREIKGRQEAAKKLAAEFNATFIPLQEIFNKAFEKYPPAEYWLWDGIHPMPNGHELIAREWISQVGKKEKIIR